MSSLTGRKFNYPVIFGTTLVTNWYTTTKPLQAHSSTTWWPTGLNPPELYVNLQYLPVTCLFQSYPNQIPQPYADFVRTFGIPLECSVDVTVTNPLLLAVYTNFQNIPPTTAPNVSANLPSSSTAKRTVFKSPDLTQAGLEQLSDVRQGSKEYHSAYMERVRALVSKANPKMPLSEREKPFVTHFVRGLYDDTIRTQLSDETN